MEANYKNQFKIIKRRVFCTTTAAIAQGEGVVYDYTSTTNELATVEDRSRAKLVKTPAATTDQFARVLLAAKPAGAGWIDIACPGSDLLVLLGETSATIGDIVTLDTGTAPGSFMNDVTAKGSGAVTILQTVAAAGLVHAKLIEGSPVTLAASS